MRGKKLGSVVVVTAAALLLAGRASPPANHGGASGSSIASLTSTNTITNDQSNWIDWPPPPQPNVGRVF